MKYEVSFFFAESEADYVSVVVEYHEEYERCEVMLAAIEVVKGYGINVDLLDLGAEIREIKKSEKEVAKWVI